MNGKTVAIVGSATGIGRAAARKWASQGANVALFDNSADGLKAVADQISANSNATVSHKVGDVGNLKDLQEFQKEVFTKHPDGVDILFLNAGIQFASKADDADAIAKLMSINFMGMVNGVTAFLSSLKGQKKPAHIVLTGSKQGITNPPGNFGYNASKAALKSYAEGLAFSLDTNEDTKHLKAHLLVPGWTFTALSGNRDSDETPKPAGAWTADQVVEVLDDGLSANQFYILCPDNEVSVELDKKRMQWNLDDILKDRPALTRWRPDYKDQVAKYFG